LLYLFVFRAGQTRPLPGCGWLGFRRLALILCHHAPSSWLLVSFVEALPVLDHLAARLGDSLLGGALAGLGVGYHLGEPLEPARGWRLQRLLLFL